MHITNKVPAYTFLLERCLRTIQILIFRVLERGDQKSFICFNIHQYPPTNDANRQWLLMIFINQWPFPPTTTTTAGSRLPIAGLTLSVLSCQNCLARKMLNFNVWHSMLYRKELASKNAKQ